MEYREQNVIPPRRQIQRDFPHRNHKKFNHGHFPGKKFAPGQFKSNPSFKPMPPSGPNSTPNSSPNPSLSGLKRKELDAENQTPHQAQSFSGNQNKQAKTDDSYCQVCHVSCSGRQAFQQHLVGRKHKAKTQGHTSFKGPWNCDQCKISCTSERLLMSHFQGQVHQNMVRKLESRKTEGGEISSQRRYCNLCNIWCIDEVAFEQHIEGKKHIFSVSTNEIEKKAREEAAAQAGVDLNTMDG